MCQPRFFSTTTLRLLVASLTVFLCVIPVLANTGEDGIQPIKDAVGENALVHTHNSDGSLTVQVNSDPENVLRSLASLEEAYRRRIDNILFACLVPDSPNDLRLLEKLTRLKEIRI